MKRTISLLIPVYNEEQSFPDCLLAVLGLKSRVEERLNLEVDILIIDNHSSDNTLELVRLAAEIHPEIRFCSLGRNYGVQASLLFGMSQSNSDALIVIQADLQDPMDIAYLLIEKWAETGCGVVAGITTDRAEGFIDRSTRNVFYKILSKTSDFGLLPWFHDFYVLDKRVFSQLYRQGFQHEFIRGRIAEEYGVDFTIPYSRKGRIGGASSFNFSRKYSMALDGVLRYGNKLGRWISLGSLSIVLGNLVLLFVILFSWLLGYRSTTQGWMSLIALNLMILAAVGFLTAIAFEYLFRILRLSEVSNRPAIQFKNY